MISFDTAERIALAHLSELEGDAGENLSLLKDQTIEEPFGWVFFYNSTTFAETGDALHALAGNSPFIVDR